MWARPGAARRKFIGCREYLTAWGPESLGDGNGTEEEGAFVGMTWRVANCKCLLGFWGERGNCGGGGGIVLNVYTKSEKVLCV